MDEERIIEMESRIQELLAGELSQAEMSELLAEIARNDDARRILSEMIELQRQSRRCFGYDVDDAATKTSLAGTIDAMRSTHISAGTTRGRRNACSLIRRFAWPMRVAAMVAIAISVFVAITARRDNRLLRGQLSGGSDQIVALPEPSDDELENIRQVWEKVSEGSGDYKPWVLLSNDGGEFAYMPTDKHTANEHGLILLRCVIVDPEKQIATRMNLLLPARQIVHLTIPDAGRLYDQPISMVISASNEWTGVGLKVGADSDSLSGVCGRVQVGNSTVEIGQFCIDGKKMRVFLQAMALNGGTT